MAILITGAAGFIGFHLSRKLLDRGEEILGIDNLCDYYDVTLKLARLELLKKYKNFSFVKLDITNRAEIQNVVSDNSHIRKVAHLAAQAGVRYSLIDPYSYTATNIEGHLNLLEAFKGKENLEHFVYASSSSVYGANTNLPFSIKDRVDLPLSLYAATKKSMELMSHCYSHLFHMPMTGLRFFTVYGPWGRPDMAMFIFTRKILAREPIQVFNHGDMRRDFTYIEDIVDGIISCLDNAPVEDGSPPCRVYNIGNNKSEGLLDMIKVIEKALGCKATMELLPMQAGDFKETYADISESTLDFGYKPKFSLEEGVPKFIEWYKEYYGVNCISDQNV